MATIHDVEIWVMVNESGEYEVGTDSDCCGEQFTANCGTNEAVRKFCLKLRVPSPEPMTLAGDVPPEPVGAIALSVV